MFLVSSSCSVEIFAVFAVEVVVSVGSLRDR